MSIQSPPRLPPQVTLVAACNLAAAGSPYHRIDPCARLSLGDQLQDTAVVPDTRFPAWDLIAPFDLNDDTRELRVSARELPNSSALILTCFTGFATNTQGYG